MKNKSQTSTEQQTLLPSRRRGVSFVSDDIAVLVEHSLLELFEDLKAKCALVIDRTGVIMASQGDFFPHGPQTLGAVAAGVMAALNAMTAETTSPEIAIKVYGSETDKIHYLLVGEQLILCILYGKNSTSGQVRAAAKAFANKVGPSVSRRESNHHVHADLKKSVEFIESKLDDLFRDHF